MIYSVYFAGLTDKYAGLTPLDLASLPIRFRNKNLKALLANNIKDETKDDTFIFITTNAQRDTWNSFIETYGLKDHVSFSMERPVTNGNHDMGRNLTLHVLTTKKEELK